MKRLTEIFTQRPIYLLLAVNIIIGLFTHRSYGLSWDEPLFYEYADSLGYAYSPREWFSGHFNLENSYGSSADDHKTRGPAYLLLARNVVYGIELLGADAASAWHLTNFLFFQLGIYLLYRLATRWMSLSSALFVSALFAYQPLLWGHAFINPKDPPFLTFFLASICFGFEMVDSFVEQHRPPVGRVVLAAASLGIATSIRVLGPLAGILVSIYALARLGRNITGHFSRLIGYGTLATLVAIAAWPLLWENPTLRFFEVFRLMSDNPTELAVLFHGEIFRANDMPLRYLPFMLITTLTEPVWFLFALGLVAGIWKFAGDKKNTPLFVSLLLTLSWPAILVLYVLLRNPAMYDGLRHVLFILPPIFISAGLGFERFVKWCERTFAFLFSLSGTSAVVSVGNWLRAGLGFLLILPGFVAFHHLHPYEYTYYNSFVGGTSGAFREYETDYWLTCYKEAVQRLDEIIDDPVTLYVLREGYVAAYYETQKVTIREARGAANELRSGDYILLSTRRNADRTVFKDALPIFQVQRGDAIFCAIKRIP